MKTKIEELNLELKSKVPHLNEGGCGVFVLFMYIYLKFTLKKHTNILAVTYEDYDVYNHFLIDCDGYIFDGYNNYKTIFEYMSIDYVKKVEVISIFKLIWIFISYDWNKKYDNRFNRVIKNKIKEILK